jgi:hypothetical protein
VLFSIRDQGGATDVSNPSLVPGSSFATMRLDQTSLAEWNLTGNSSVNNAQDVIIASFAIGTAPAAATVFDISGTAAAGTTVTVTNENGEVVATVTAAADGSFSISKGFADDDPLYPKDGDVLTVNTSSGASSTFTFRADGLDAPIAGSGSLTITDFGTTQALIQTPAATAPVAPAPVAPAPVAPAPVAPAPVATITADPPTITAEQWRFRDNQDLIRFRGFLDKPLDENGTPLTLHVVFWNGGEFIDREEDLEIIDGMGEYQVRSRDEVDVSDVDTVEMYATDSDGAVVTSRSWERDDVD